MLERLLKEAYHRLSERHVSYALAGGLLASYYRAEIRTTLDVDIALALSDGEGIEVASAILRDLGIEPKSVTLGGLRGAPGVVAKKTPIAIIGGRTSEEGLPYGLDFLLPTLPWVESAVQRARNNFIDFGFGKIPALTVEDVLVSKLYSYLNRSDRYKDLDDIQSIIAKGHEFDWEYMAASLKKHGLFFPERFEKSLPVNLQRISKKLRKKAKM